MSTAELKKFGRMLREWRKLRGYSVRTLEERSGINKSMISRVENGGDCCLTTLHRFAKALSVKITITP